MNVKERQLMVREFCRHMNMETRDTPGKPPLTLVDQFFHKLREEVAELHEAAGVTGKPLNYIELVDALRDVEYLLYGIELLFGVQDASDDSFMEVHYSNMTKTPHNGVPWKAEGYTKPKIGEALRRVFPKQQLLFRS